MALDYLGSLTIGATIPGPVAALSLAVPDLQARLDALAAFAPADVSLSAQLTLATDILANINTSISLGISPPSIAAQISAVAALIAGLEADLLAIVAVTDLFATAGVHAYAYSGRADALGAAFSAELSGGFPGGSGADTTNALLLATTIGATWTAMGGVFKVTP